MVLHFGYKYSHKQSMFFQGVQITSEPKFRGQAIVGGSILELYPKSLAKDDVHKRIIELLFPSSDHSVYST